MPLLRNQNQPYFPDPNSPNRYNCNGSYCYPIASGDIIRNQLYQTPCSGSVITDPEFADFSLGADLLGGDGSFTGGTTGWTLGAGWVYGTNDVDKTAGNTNSIAYGSVGMTISQFYRIQFTIVRTAGTIYAQLGDGAGATISFAVDESGTYDVDIVWGDALDDTLQFVPSIDFAGTLDSVTIKQITYAAWEPNGQWSLASGRACKAQLGTGILEETVADYIVAGGYYQLKFTVTDYESGTLVPFVSDVQATTVYNASITVDANGDYTLYYAPTITGVLSFVPSSDFIGCIEAIELFEMRNDYTGDVVDEAGDSVYQIDQEFSYFEDKVTLAIDFNGVDLEFGCYTIVIYDACLVEGNDLMTNGDFSDGSTGWSASAPFQFSVAAGEATIEFDPLQGSNLVTNGDFSGGGAGWTATNWVIAAGATHTPGNISALSRSVTISAPPPAPNYMVWWIQVTMSGRTAGSLTLSLGNAIAGTYQDNGSWCVRVAPTIGGSITLMFTPTSNFDGTIDDIQVYERTQADLDGVTIYNTTNPLITAANYSASFDITALTGGSLGAGFSVLGMGQAIAFETAITTHTVSIPNYVPGAQTPVMVAIFGELDSAGGSRSYVGTVTFDNIELVRVEPFEATYTTECLNYALTHPRTKLVTAYSDNEAFGFEFTNTGFLLQQRIYCRSIAPSYPQAVNIAKYGDGTAEVTYGELEKYWQLHTAPMSESAHDAMAAQRLMDHFIIGDSAMGTEYVVDTDEYSPAWNTSGSYDLATSVITLRVKTGGMNFNRHVT